MVKLSFKGHRFCKFNKKENDAPVNTVDETSQKFSDLKAAKRERQNDVEAGGSTNM